MHFNSIYGTRQQDQTGVQSRTLNEYRSNKGGRENIVEVKQGAADQRWITSN